MKPLQTIGLASVVVGLALGAGFVWAFRTRYAPVQDRVRRFNRDVTNQRVLERAGSAGVSEAVVHHRGRTTGTAYRTPVVPVRTDAGFVIGLPYGPGADWVRNVLDAGGATLEFDGRRHDVVGELVPVAEAAQWFDPGEQRVQRLFGIDQVLVLHDRHAETSTGSAGDDRVDVVD
ncbi:nitroreductase/quinone reductase family protein [Salsipaludibacter albus]|uniref:nitroreductase/quinone reductase family protein n=1 Tax=Salsipaludibacter albus TaxID=2849650 RepID=UPI001EE4BD4E|nr:nitroreductase/quinone reductase family protein [Salsipaludibacter albus]MBY5163616.1 nitroreductase family deazaflavin-dependent oxidoreductase [Salsipaludibacter albus]